MRCGWREDLATRKRPAWPSVLEPLPRRRGPDLDKIRVLQGRDAARYVRLRPLQGNTGPWPVEGSRTRRTATPTPQTPYRVGAQPSGPSFRAPPRLASREPPRASLWNTSTLIAQATGGAGAPIVQDTVLAGEEC